MRNKFFLLNAQKAKLENGTLRMDNGVKKVIHYCFGNPRAE